MAFVKTVNGLALASVKTVDGLAAASIKTILGVDATTGGSSWDFEENFETPTTGYENSGWTTYSSANPAYSTSPAPLQGTQSLYAATGALRGAYRSRAATGEVWLYWQMYLIAGVVNDYQFYGDVFETSVRVGFSGGKIRLYAAGSVSDAAGTFPLDQKVHVWIRYKPSTGSNGEGELWYSTDGIKPGSPQCSISGASGTTEMSRPWWVSRNTYAVLWDRIIINSTSIGDNP